MDVSTFIVYSHALKAADKYYGQWQAGMKHGVGKELLLDGSKYEGHYICGRRNGFGKLIWNEGRYEGPFIGDQMHGNCGKLWYDSGQRYFGSFFCGKWNDWGIWKNATGDMYHGFFSHGERNGPGIFLDADIKSGPRRRAGEWKNGKVVEWTYWLPDRDATEEFCARFSLKEDLMGAFGFSIARKLPHLPAGVDPRHTKVQDIVCQIARRETPELLGDTTLAEAQKKLPDLSNTYFQLLDYESDSKKACEKLECELGDLEARYNEEIENYQRGERDLKAAHDEINIYWKDPGRSVGYPCT